MSSTKENLEALVKELGLTVEAEFVPFSRSRNAKPEAKVREMSLNWKVTVKKDGREVLSTDYQAGIGHCPGYINNKSSVLNMDAADAIALECEKGREAGRFGAMGKPIMPDSLAVLHSLVSDASVLDYGTFEDWARYTGSDPDSRKEEKIYQACLQIALKLRNGIGEDGLAKLQEGFWGY